MERCFSLGDILPILPHSHAGKVTRSALSPIARLLNNCRCVWPMCEAAAVYYRPVLFWGTSAKGSGKQNHVINPDGGF